MEMGFLSGRGVLDGEPRLDLELMDDTIVASTGDVVSPWGSENGTPYVVGIPHGKVVPVYNSPRETARRDVIEPSFAFTALALVGVVVPTAAHSHPTVR